MRPVITISLNGNSYQLEQEGYEALRAYLATAEARLADNPDRGEILADLEQAIAEKCGGYLNPHRTVVTAEEVRQVIQDMGPVDGDAAEASAGSDAAQAQSAGPSGSGTGPTPQGAARRLYQIREGAMLSGVCNGIAAYFNVDVTLVRLIFVVATLLTGGLWIVAYLVMMFVIPYAQTPEEHAAAHGWAFNAQELIDRAKRHYAQFKDGHQWRQRWREQRRFWKAQQRQWRAQARYWRQYHRTVHEAPPPAWGTPPDHVNHAAYILGGLFIPIAAILNALLFGALILAIGSLVTTHGVFGWALPPQIPLWAAIVIAVVLYSFVASPLRFARHAGYYGPLGYAWFALWGVLWTVLLAVFVWLAWWHWADVQLFLQHLSLTLHDWARQLKSNQLNI
jgi:phage shock protein PspC (stress-responsive transcriptional regulator)